MKSTVLKQLEIKIVRLHTLRLQQVTIDNNDQNMILGEKSSLFHLLKMRNLRQARMIHKLQADDTPRWDITMVDSVTTQM